MLKLVSSIGNAAYKTATKTGLTAGSEQPPYPCALPLQGIESSNDIEQIESILDFTFESVRDMLGDMPILNSKMTDPKLQRTWKPVDYKDSEGDLHLFTRPHVGPYNFARATMSLINVRPEMVLSLMHVQDLKQRNRYSENLSHYDIIARNPELPPHLFDKLGDDNYHLVELAQRGVRDWHLEYNQYYAPPPVASRDFIYLIEKRYVPEDDSYYIYGCSVDLKDCAMSKTKCVRGAVMFGWEFTMVGDTTMTTYVSCMNPNGWAPTFIVGWMKTEIAKEFQNSRRLMYAAVSKNVEEMSNVMKRSKCLNSHSDDSEEDVDVERDSFKKFDMFEESRLTSEDERLFDVEEDLIVLE